MNIGVALSKAADGPGKIFIRPVGLFEGKPRFKTATFYPSGETTGITSPLQLVEIVDGKVKFAGNYWLFRDMVSMVWEEVLLDELLMESK